jgi:hypothetical protein
MPAALTSSSSKFCDRVDVDFADLPLGLPAADMPKADVTSMSRRARGCSVHLANSFGRFVFTTGTGQSLSGG